MQPLLSAAQQRHVLIIGFTLLFGVSLVVILFERAQKQELISRSREEISLAASVVKGQAASQNQAMALYHAQARQIATLLFSNITKLEQGQTPNYDELAAARQAIIGIVVPAIYQKLHIKLLKILNNLEAGPATDLNYLSEQRSLLQEEFPWL